MDLVGRHDEMALLERFLSPDPVEAGPRALLLRGEPGTGKTALINHAYATAHGVKFRLNAQEALQSVALAATSEMLRDLFELRDQEGIVSQLISGTGAQSPVQIYESVRRRLTRTKATLVIDDLQWLDDVSAGLVHFLMNAARSYEEDLRVVAATRPGPTASAFIDATQRADIKTEVREIGGLGEEDGIRLIQGLARSVDTGRARAIWERSRGVPYWMIALTVNPEAEALGSVLEARLHGASDDAAGLLASLAVIGRPVDVAELASIQSWGQDRVKDVVDELDSRGLVRRTGSRFQVIHDLIREAVVQDLTDSAYVEAHRRIVTWLESSEEPSRERRLETIEHRMAAGLPAISHALELTRSDGRFLLGDDGLATIVRVADTEEAKRSDDLLVAVAALASDMGVAELALDRWSIVFHQSSDSNTRARAAIGAAAAALDLDRTVDARQWVELAKQTKPTDPAVVVESLAVAAGLCMFHEHAAEEGRRLAEESVSLANTALGSDSGVIQDEHVMRVRLNALQALHDAYMMHKNPTKAASVAEAMVQVAPTARDRLVALTNVGITMRHLGRIREAASVFDTVWTESNRTALLSVAARSAPWYAAVLFELGRLEKAKEVAAEGRHIADRLGLTRYQRFTARQFHNVELLTEDWHAGLERLQAGVRVEEDPHWRLALHELIGRHLSRIGTGDPTHALAEIDAAYQDALIADCKRCMTDVLVEGILIAARSGDRARAEQWIERYRRADVEVDPYLQASLDHAHALLSHEDTDLKLAVAGYEALGMRVGEMWARLDLARVWAREGRRSEAAEAYRALAEAAASIGAVTVQEIAEKGLRQLGVRTWRRKGATDRAALTEREQEIAALVASGATNPEIAEALFLSRKTIERHVSNILAKTGSRNRIELARAWDHDTNEGAPR
ncbi:MAG: AAA family ATPase [Acidimicrobiia bacterium]